MSHQSKQIVIGTFYSEEKRKISSLNGATACFIVVTENFNKFIEKTRKNKKLSLAILSKQEASESYANEFMSLAEDYKINNNDHWYYYQPLQETINLIQEDTSFPKIYSPT